MSETTYRVEWGTKGEFVDVCIDGCDPFNTASKAVLQAERNSDLARQTYCLLSMRIPPEAWGKKGGQ